MVEFIDNEDLDYPREQENNNIWDEKQFLEVLKHYAEDSTIPENLRTKEWAIFGKALVNTFLTEKDLALIDIYSQILRIDELSRKPPHLITFDEVNNLDRIQLYLFLTSKRAIGIEQNRINERTLQNTQIGQSISTQIGVQQRKGFSLNPFSRFKRGI